MKIAVVGGGVAGLTAGYLLHKRHEVTLFEKSNRLGGNAYTHRTPDGEHPDIAVAAFGQAGYKNFYRLLDELEIDTEPCFSSYMSFHDLEARDGLYLTPSLRRSITQRFQMLRPAHVGSLVYLFTGLQKAQRLLDSGAVEGLTVARCLDKVPELSGETRIILLCAWSLLSSMESAEVLDAPAAFFLKKLRVHHDVLSPKAAYSVRCVRDGTRAYVNALSAGYRRNVVLGARLAAVRRDGEGVSVILDDGTRRVFDRVVMACNPDQALALLADPTDAERELLGAWRYKDGRVVVHRDHSAFPPRDLIESYTFLYSRSGGGAPRISVNGALWHEPHVAGDAEYISSQHPNFAIRPELIDLDVRLRTPIYDFKSWATIPRLPSLNGVRRTYYCGSYFGYGLHEDAVSSAMAAVRSLAGESAGAGAGGFGTKNDTVAP